MHHRIRSTCAERSETYSGAPHKAYLTPIRAATFWPTLSIRVSSPVSTFLVFLVLDFSYFMANVAAAPDLSGDLPICSLLPIYRFFCQTSQLF